MKAVLAVGAVTLAILGSSASYGAGIVGLSCPKPNWCVAIDGGGGWKAFDPANPGSTGVDGKFTTKPIKDPDYRLQCFEDEKCLIIDRNGNMWYGNSRDGNAINSTWSAN